MLNELFKLSLYLIMLGALGSGLLYGIGISFMLGTVFFTLISNGQKQGWKAGAFIATGVILSDILFISLALFVGKQTENWVKSNESMLFLGGGLLLIVLGLGQWKIKYLDSKSSQKKQWSLVPLGFALNISNPINFLVWLGMISLLAVENYDEKEQLLFLLASLLGIFLAEVCVASLAKFLLKGMSQKAIFWFQKGLSIIFIGFGLWLVFKGFFELF